jgi:D-arabinose 5-phosphate isomerase GutQ
MSEADAARVALDVTAGALAALRDRADVDAIVRAADLIADGTFTVTCGSGSSGFAAAKFAHSLCCVEKPAKFLPPSEAIHGGLGVISAGDVLVMVTRGGETAELMPILDLAIRRQAHVVGLTENLDSRLAHAAEVVVPLVVTRESDPLQTMATTSNLVVGALLDAVLAAVMVRTGYTTEKFAVIHPGGAVGARLNKEA